MKTLGELLKESRLSKGYRLNQVSKYCSISIAYLSDLENGKAKRPKITILQKASEILQINSDILIISAEKIPPDVYWKIVHNPALLEVIRAHEV